MIDDVIITQIYQPRPKAVYGIGSRNNLKLEALTSQLWVQNFMSMSKTIAKRHSRKSLTQARIGITAKEHVYNELLELGKR